MGGMSRKKNCQRNNPKRKEKREKLAPLVKDEVAPCTGGYTRDITGLFLALGIGIGGQTIQSTPHVVKRTII